MVVRLIHLSFVALGIVLLATCPGVTQDPDIPVLPEGAERPANFQDLKKVYEPLGIKVFRPNVEPAQGVSTQLGIPYVQQNGRQLQLDLFLPKQSDSAPPLVVLIHGGGWRFGDKKHEHPKAIWLANHGYAAASVQYRFSTEASFPAPLNDCKAAISFLRSKANEFGFDADSIAVFGGSAGGHLAALVASSGEHPFFENAEESNSVQAAVIVGNPPDSTHPWAIAESRKPGSDYRLFLGGSYDDNPDVFTQASPVNYVSSKTPPCLFVDEEFNPSSVPMRDKVEELGIVHDYLLLTGGIHGEWNWEPWFSVTMNRAHDFLEKVFSKKSERIVVKEVGFALPESAEHYLAEDVYLVSNINGDFAEEDGNGFISKLKPDGSVIDLKWIDGTKPGVTLNAPKGMAVIDDLLFVADVTYLQVFDLSSGMQKASIKIDDSSFLNGVTPGPDGSVYVSDTGIKWEGESFGRTHTDAIYQIWPDGRYETLVKDDQLDRPNGLVASGDELFVVTVPGRLLRVDGSGNWSSLAPPPIDGLDGLVLLDDGRLLISTYMGSAIYAKNLDDSYTILVPDIVAPADIGFDATRQRILVPRLVDGELVVVPLE